jgi:hypothetical protein
MHSNGVISNSPNLASFGDKVSALAAVLTIIDGSGLHESPPESNKKNALEYEDSGRPSEHSRSA